MKKITFILLLISNFAFSQSSITPAWKKNASQDSIAAQYAGQTGGLDWFYRASYLRAYLNTRFLAKIDSTLNGGYATNWKLKKYVPFSYIHTDSQQINIGDSVNITSLLNIDPAGKSWSLFQLEDDGSLSSISGASANVNITSTGTSGTGLIDMQHNSGINLSWTNGSSGLIQGLGIGVGTAGSEVIQLRDQIHHRGIDGAENFSANLNSLSYPQKIYVDNAISSAALTFNNGLTNNSGIVGLNGTYTTVDVNGATDNYLNLSSFYSAGLVTQMHLERTYGSLTSRKDDGPDARYYGFVAQTDTVKMLYNKNGVNISDTTKSIGLIIDSLHATFLNNINKGGITYKNYLRTVYNDSTLTTLKKVTSLIPATPSGGFASKDSSLQANKNLYELTDKAVSRNNLSVYSKTQSDANYIQNIGTLQVSALFNVSKGTITGTTPATVSTSTGTNAAVPLIVLPGNGGDNSKSTGTASGGNAADLSITMGKGGSVTGSPATGIGGNGGNINLLSGDAGNVTGTTKIPGMPGEFIAQGGLSSNVDGGSGGNTSIKGGNGETSHNTTGGNVFLVAGQGHGTGLDGGIFIDVSAGSTVRGNTIIASSLDDHLHRLQVTGSIIATDTGIMPRIKLNGTAGNGLIDYIAQSSTPTTPAANHQISYADASGRFTLMGSNGFAASLTKALLTASRIYSFPDSAGTIALESRIIPNSNLANPTISGIALGANLANLTNGIGINSLSYNGSSAQSVTIDTSTIVSKTFAGRYPLTNSAASFSGATITGLTASQAVFTNGSKQLVSNAITGSGNVVMSTSPTFTTGVNLSSAGNAMYTSDAPTGSNSGARLRSGTTGSISDYSINSGVGSVNSLRFTNNKSGNTVMTLNTSDNVGIGTGSPLAKVNVLSTTEQIRTSYDVSNYLSITTGSTGTTTLVPTGTTPILAIVGNTNITGNLSLLTAGNKISIATGSNASVGTATLVAGTVTVSTTAVTSSSKIFLTDATTGALTNIGTPTVGTIVNGTSFVINSSNILDTSNINWFIIN